MTEVATLMLAAFAFFIAGFFWVSCWASKVPFTRMLAFWYAVTFNNIGYFLLLYHGVIFL